MGLHAGQSGSCNADFAIVFPWNQLRQNQVHAAIACYYAEFKLRAAQLWFRAKGNPSSLCNSLLRLTRSASLSWTLHCEPARAATQHNPLARHYTRSSGQAEQIAYLEGVPNFFYGCAMFFLLLDRLKKFLRSLHLAITQRTLFDL